MVPSENISYSKRLLQLISWSHWFTFFNIWLAVMLSSLYIFSEPLPESPLGIFYLGTTWVSHMAFLTFFGFVLFVFPVTILLPHTRFIRSLSSIAFTIGLLLLVLDGFIYSQLGYHINASSKGQILALIQQQISSYSVWFWLFTVILFIIVLTLELVLSNYAWKHLKQLQKTRFAKRSLFILVPAFITSHLIHIWADANLDYNILKQDTLLPLSYPTTAKALLTKYGLFDREDYIERRNSPLTFTDNIKPYPEMGTLCTSRNEEQSQLVSQSTFIIVTNKSFSQLEKQILSKRSFSNAWTFTHHIDNAISDDAWFNLFYSLPSLYKNNVLSQHQPPAIFQLLKQNKIPSTFTQISSMGKQQKVPEWFTNLFDETKSLSTISSLVFSERLSKTPIGLHVLYFNDESNYQFELFIDALQLSQRTKAHKDIIWASTIGNETDKTQLANKTAVLLWPNKHAKRVEYLTSQMDVMPTLITHWLGCKANTLSYSNGSDLLKLNKNRVIANTTDDGLMIFNKDKSVFVDQNSNFQSYSRQLNAPIIESDDFPLMIDGVHFIKQFSQQKTSKE